jgi:hypothetical protein
LVPTLIARFFSSSFASRIKDLHDHDKRMTGALPVSAHIGAPVEFRRRAGLDDGRS